MLLYRTQPRDDVHNNIINLNKKEDLINNVGVKFKRRKITSNDATALLTDASVIDGLITSGGYENILVVTSFEDRHYDELRDRIYRPVNSAGDHYLPIVHKVNESAGNMVVTMTKNADNYMKPLYEQYEVPTVEAESYFRLDEDFRIKTSTKFDCVVLLGCEASRKGTHKVSDIKKKFSKYCTSDFDLIDVYRNDARKISGGTQDISSHVERMVECVNTPKRMYDKKNRIIRSAESKVFAFYRLFPTRQLLYYRLVLNLENANEYYKVY